MMAEGLLAIWTTLEEDYRNEFRKWHSCEHIRDRISIPGFCTARRYQGIGDTFDFLMCYETEDTKVLASEPYLWAVNHPTPWTREIIAHSKKTVRAIYSLLSTAGERPLLEAPYLITLAFNIDFDQENVVLQECAEAIRKACLLPGVCRSRLYRMDEETSGLKTEERKMHGGGPGEQKFLLLYEATSLNVADRRDWQDLHTGSGFLKRLRDVRFDSFWLDFWLTR